VGGGGKPPCVGKSPLKIGGNPFGILKRKWKGPLENEKGRGPEKRKDPNGPRNEGRNE